MAWWRWLFGQEEEKDAPYCVGDRKRHRYKDGACMFCGAAGTERVRRGATNDHND